MVFKLALKNILSEGFRTWINVMFLSFSFIAILFLYGLYNSMNYQLEKAKDSTRFSGCQIWHNTYNPHDPVTFEDAHGTIPIEIQRMIKQKHASPILMRMATIYPHGRITNVILRGIDPDQQILSIPSASLKSFDKIIPALIGSHMAKNNGLKIGDYVTVRWRNTSGIFDADEVKIVEIIETSVPEFDNLQLWIPIDTMRRMITMPEEATIIILKKGITYDKHLENWTHKNVASISYNLKLSILTQSSNIGLLCIILLLLTLLCILNILSIFRRKKEIGILMATGMSRLKIIQLFTIEEAILSILAVFIVVIYNSPISIYTTKIEYLPESIITSGFTMGNHISSSFTMAFILGVILLGLTVTTILSYLPDNQASKQKSHEPFQKNL